MRKAEAIKSFSQSLEYLSRSMSKWDVFQDFLDFSLIMLKWWDLKPENFSALEKKYPDTDQHRLFAQAYCAIGHIAGDDGDGFADPFGDWFMENLSSDRNGQFFTPVDMCKMMAQMTLGESIPDGTSICDPACGSGRTLLECGRINRKAIFYAADIDLACCKMTVINFLLNTMTGEVAWMDTIRMTHWRSWHINKVMDGAGMYRPYYIETGPGETSFVERLEKTLSSEPVAADADVKANKKGQILLF